MRKEEKGLFQLEWESVQRVRSKREQCVVLGPRSNSKWLKERVKGENGTDETSITKDCENVKYHYPEAMGAFKVWSMGWHDSTCV